MSDFIAAVECAIEHKGKFLIIERPQEKHAGGLLSFPGGKVEFSDAQEGEDILIRAVKREIFEEVGLRLEGPIHYITSSSFPDSTTGDPVIDVVFYCSMTQVPEILNVCLREVPNYYWFNREEAASQPNCPDWLVRYMDKIENFKKTIRNNIQRS